MQDSKQNNSYRALACQNPKTIGQRRLFLPFTSLLRFAGFLFLFGLLLRCQNPSLPITPLSALPETLTDGFNAERWYFTDVRLKVPFTPQKAKNINAQATPFLFAVRNKLLFTTFNGYLVSMNRNRLNDVDRIHLARGISAPPAFYRPLVFVSAEKGKYGLQAYDLFQRKVIWKKKRLFSRANPLLQEGVVFHATLNGSISAFHSVTGKLLWEYGGGFPLTGNLAMHNDTLVACGQNGQVLCLDGTDGSVLWKTKIGSHLYASPMIARGKIYLADLNGNVRALRLSNGKPLFLNHLGNAPFYRPCTTDGHNIFCMNAQGRLYRLTPDLALQWRTALKGVPMFPVWVSANYLLVATAQKYWYIIDKAGGKIVQQELLSHRVAGVLPAEADVLYLVTEYNKVAKWVSKGAQEK